MTKPIFVDTSYFLALVNSHDEFHQQASILGDQMDVTLFTTEAILTEIGNALAKSQLSRNRNIRKNHKSLTQQAINEI